MTLNACIRKIGNRKKIDFSGVSLFHSVNVLNLKKRKVSKGKFLITLENEYPLGNYSGQYCSQHDVCFSPFPEGIQY